MPTQREIEVRIIAKSTIDVDAVESWLESIGVDTDRYEHPNPNDVPDTEYLVALAGKRCYMSFEAGLNPNVTRIRQDYAAYFDNILSSGHGSVLEHACFTLSIEGVTRVFTAEMNRHRAGWAISEGSLRFIRFDKDIPFWMPLSIRADEKDDEDLANRKAESRRIFMEAFSRQEEAYGELIKVWDMEEGNHNFAYKKKVTSCLRRIVGMGVSTGGIWTGNVRALRHVLTMRCSPVAEEEICHVFSMVAAEISKTNPLVFGDFHQDENGFWRPKYVKV